MDFYDSIWQDCSDTGIITGAYIIFIKVGQLTMAHIFQDQLLNQFQRVSTIHNALQEWL